MSDTPESGAPKRAPDTRQANDIRALLSVGLVAAAVAVGVIPMFYPLPKDAPPAVYQGLDWIRAAAWIAIGYWLGSSQGSADKTALLSKGDAP